MCFQTNTFQCILTTDGVRSFALLRYGDMRWGRGQRKFHDALIGYTDGTTAHTEPTLPPSNLFGFGGRYRPQQVDGTLGLPGQLVYDFTAATDADVDAGIKCQRWAMTEPAPGEWTPGLPACPCTRTQALGDLAFIQETATPGERLSTLRGQRSSSGGGHVFKSILFNVHGSGKRCVYELEGPLLAGFSERYFTEENTQRHIGKSHFSVYKQTG